VPFLPHLQEVFVNKPASTLAIRQHPRPPVIRPAKPSPLPAIRKHLHYTRLPATRPPNPSHLPTPIQHLSVPSTPSGIPCSRTLMARIFLRCYKSYMPNLKTDTILVSREGISRQYQVKENDHGDLVVYDVFLKDDYLLTLSKDGDILFMNFEATEQEKEIFKLAFLHQVIEKVKDI
jgi:hypothetical protein